MKTSKFLFTLICVLSFNFMFAQTPGLTERNLMNPTNWYWLTGVSASSIKQKTDQGYRIIDLQVESTAPLKFSAAFVKNSGAHKKSWWWYYGKSSNQVKQLLQSKGARIIDMEIYFVNGQKKYAVVMVSNKGVHAKSWWYYSQLSFNQMKAKIAEKNARIVDLDTYVKSGTRYFSVVMIKNTGKDKKGWWYYTNLTLPQLKQKLAKNKARITDIEVRGSKPNMTFSVVMEKLKNETWWYYYGKTMTQIKDLASQNAARIIDIEPYKDKYGKKRFAVAMLRNSNAATNNFRKYLKNNVTGGAYGAYLKQVNGAVKVSLQSKKGFYPASTIKVLQHVHAMRAVDKNQVSLNTNVTTYDNASQSCQNSHAGHTPTVLSMETILQTMMENSDNQNTNAVQEFFGNGNAVLGRTRINNTAHSVLNMSSTTQLNHKLGCGGPNNNPANVMNLKDLGKLYERVATGLFKKQSTTDKFYQLMLTGKGQINTIVDEEGQKLGMSSSARQSFKSKIKTAAKAGNIGTSYISIAGWVSLPLKRGKREFVFGVFVDEASSVKPGFSIWDSRAELLRSEIKKALIAFK